MTFCKYLTSVIFIFCLFHNVWPSCDFQEGKYDLSPLDMPEGWRIAFTTNDGKHLQYVINVCGAINSTSADTKGCTNSSVCQISGDTTTSFSNAILGSQDYSIASHTQIGFTIYLHTRKACGNVGNYRSSINFVCGPNLGVPEVVLWSDCQVNIYWKTYAACLDKPKTRQVPCYALDDKGESHDLSPLIKQESGYFVNTRDPAVDFVINVCSAIVPNNATRRCPSGSSACLINGNDAVLFGKPESGLRYTEEGLLLTYKTSREDHSSYNAQGCHLDPKTTVLFKCPPRGHSQPPKVISDSNCQYEIEWETEHACPQSSLKSSLKTCQFDSDTHGVEIDLSPLKEKDYYLVDSSHSNTTKFAISMCGGLGNFNCSSSKQWNSNSVCMIDTENATGSKVVGTTLEYDFVYADNEVILSYGKGELCDGLESSTEIHFICDTQAVEGEPRHLFSDHCVHVFEWPTKHACMKHPLDTPCSVTFDKKTINLMKLHLDKGEAWEAIDRRSVPSVASEYYINVCGQVSHLGSLSKCGDESSACISHADGSFLNLGTFSSPPVYDAASNSVKLEYSNGSPCANGNWSSAIEFICRPGQINSEPVLMRVDDSKCRYEFEWHTAEACPEGVVDGSDCKVYDSDLDINFDLNPLRSKTYVVETEDYKFHLGVCEAVKDTPCSENPNARQNVGVCQVDRVHQTSWKTGEPSSNLSYTDGVINLTYMSGDRYNDANKTARMTVLIFICDFEAGPGKPIFVDEVDFAYVFHWYTTLVCPSLMAVGTTECLARDPESHLIYDLTGLAMLRSNWMTVANEDGKELRIYLNVCRSLTRNPLCDPNAAACVVETENGVEKSFISNIGMATSPPVFNSPGHLSLTYTNGNNCTAFGENIAYSSIIHFMCADTDTSKKEPLFLNKVGNCGFSFLWATSAACPTKNLEVKESCQLTDPDSGFTFDLTPLQMLKHPHQVVTDSATYQLNVCGRIVEGCTTPDGKPSPQNASICQVDKEGHEIATIATATTYTLSYSVGRDLTLIYMPNASLSSEVVIKFPCYDGDVDYRPTLVEHEDKRFVFEMKTRLTCIPKHVDCDVVDSMGNEYDLSPLAKYHDDNWELVDPRPEKQNLRYHINFCRPLNKVTSYKCPGGASSACQTDSSNRNASGHDLGWFLNPPIANDSGGLILRYTNGSFCNAQFRRSTTVNLFCAEREETLNFIGETPECEYVFSLETPAACPLKSTHGKGCMVKDPVFGYMFDLNPLKSKNSNNYNLTVGDYEYFFNVCDQLNGMTGVCTDSSVCQTKPTDPKFSKSLGLPNDNPVYRRGVITLNYESSSICHGKYNRSTILTFTCHHGLEDKDGPSFVSEAEDCTYLFEWPTVHACPPFDVIECSVVDEKGNFYDLSPLSLLEDNYYLRYPSSKTKMFVINLCRSVVHTPTSLCPYTAASCLVDTNANSSLPVNLGKVGQAPHIADGKIKVKYTSGDPCNDEGTSTSRFWSTVIEFNCDPHGVVSEPEFVGKDDCTYYFDWNTVYACAEKPAEKSHGDCTVKDPVTGYLFNLSSLGAHGLIKTQAGHHQYYFNVCGNDSSSPCGADTAICQEEILSEKRTFKAGKPNNDLTISGSSLYLNFSGGAPCHSERYNRNAVIEFACGRGVGEPKFQYESYDCTYYFHWKTEFACQSKMHCSVENGTDIIDLSSLSTTYHTAGSSVLNDGAAYYISVCGTLPGSVGGAFCPPGSGICRVSKISSTGTFAQSLGQMNHPPIMDFIGYTTILYTNGSTCETNMALQNRARIIFICDAKQGMGEPVLIDTPEECFYLFEWSTNLVCPKKPEEDDAIISCNYTDPSQGIHFDLGALRKPHEPYEVDDDQSGNHFFLKVCSNFDAEYHHENCKTAGVCGVEMGAPLNYGEAKSQKFTYDGRRLRLTFSEGDDCPSGMDGKRSSDIFFVCDPTAGLGIPAFYKKYTCMVIFMWKTSLVCENKQQSCAFEVEGNHYDFNLLSSLSHNWNTSRGANSYWINLCHGVIDTPETRGCSSTAAVCMVDKNNNHITLGTVYGMEPKPINSSDLLLTFESGDKSACADVDPSLTPVTRIFMRCGSLLGNPKLFFGPDSKCFYDFIWESSLACPDRAEQVMLEKEGIIEDKHFGFTFNITSILNSSFTTTGMTGSDQYVYEINLSGVHPSSASSQCTQAAICQKKPSTGFSRDIGSFDTRTFILRGSELLLTFTSNTKACTKNPSKNVTTIISMQCVSAAGSGPVFVHESAECDYIFNWGTNAVCPDFHMQLPGNDTNDNHPVPDPYREEGAQSSHKTVIITGLLIAVLVLLAIVFVVAKQERRAHVVHRFRTMFGRVNLPYFRYKRSNGERLVLVDASQPHPYDDRDVEMLN